MSERAHPLKDILESAQKLYASKGASAAELAGRDSFTPRRDRGGGEQP